MSWQAAFIGAAGILGACIVVYDIRRTWPDIRRVVRVAIKGVE